MDQEKKMTEVPAEYLDQVTGGDGTGTIVCSTCGEVCSSAADFAAHMKKVHYNPYVCSFCGQIFKSGTGISEHQKKYHPKNP